MRKKTPSIQQAARKLTVYTDPRSVAAEQYRTIRTNINFAQTDIGLKTVLFTSAWKEEGKSTTACNMAIAFAEEGKKVLLVDGDMRRPTVHYTFMLNGRIGFSSLLVESATVQDAIKETQVPNLFVLPCGPIPANPAELIGSARMDKLLWEFKKNFDLVLFDSPPALSVTDARILANKCDGTILVMRAGVSEKDSVSRARDVLIASKGNVLGGILNNYRMGREYFRRAYV
ncbi:CpsD/CapB family tyrosine-protein kinase [Indiicoccus explosivorum]|uniref:CpsD/CapB family tyrosine-protein kinase n=1 Tax=Indiicoccus explosivorum TaxID=1917864 RepID=UPI000B44D80B|nr:CpsD/CapB family tyrosine-protein kinase [Indiicoccus explosivorum]